MTDKEKLNAALMKLAKAELALIHILKLSDSKAHVRSEIRALKSQETEK